MAPDDDMGSAPTLAETGPSHPSLGAAAPSLIADRYEILGLLGAGGMGRVYLARDRALDETIALKLLRRELLDLPGTLERFRQEVKLARRVTSPHVVRTFDLGEHRDDHFLTMEYIDGRSLAQLIDPGPMQLDEVLRIARAACAGIAAAHAAGILHRDLKPDNVLVAKSGRIAITDFGIAQERSAASRDFVGTPAYMAPEQLLGAPLGPATDIYALGAIMFEMLTGKRPTAGDDPRTLRNIPAQLADVVVRCLVADPAARLADAGELGSTLAALDAMASVKLTVPPAGPIVPARTSSAVALLPLQASGELAELADGLSEEIVDALTMTRDLRIVPLSSARAAARDSRDPLNVGKALSVDVVIEGSLRKRGEQVRISARAIGVVDGFQLWANHIDAPPAGLLAAGDEIARAVARALTVEISLPPRVAPSARAIELYLEGKARVRAGWFDIRMRGARNDLEEAHRLAPEDAGILATLAIALARISFVTPEAHLARARALAERAVANAPQSGEAWLALGFACLYGHAHADAAAAFSRAVRHAPGLALAQATLGGMLLEAGVLDDAIAHLEAAAALDPLHPPVADLPRAYVYAGRQADGMKLLRDATTQLHFAHVQLARFAMWRGELFHVELPDDVFGSSMGEFARYAQIAAAFHRTGRFAPGEREEIEAMIRTGSPRAGATLMQFMAEHLMFAGETVAALQYVRSAVSAGLLDALWMERCPLLAALRTDPEFQDLAATVGERARAVVAAVHAPRFSGT